MRARKPPTSLLAASILSSDQPPIAIHYDDDESAAASARRLASRPARRRRARGGAEGAFLPAQLPGGGGGGARHRGGQRGRRPRQAPRQAAPPLLPRLLRQGLRRVGADRLDGAQHGGEGRRAQHVAPRLPRHRHRQGRAGGRLPRRRLLRRHRRARRQGRHLIPVRAGPVGRAARAARRPGVQRVGGAVGHPVAVVQLHRAGGQLRQQGPRRQRPRHPLRRAHNRRRPLQRLRQPAFQLHHRRRRHRPDPERCLRRAAACAVRVALKQRDGSAHGPWQPGEVRLPLLRQPQARPGPLPVRRRAAHRPPVGRHDPPAHQGGLLPRGVQEGRPQDGPRRCAHRQPGRDKEELQSRQLLNFS